MSRGKYSLAYDFTVEREYKYNCYGKTPAPWTAEMAASGADYNQKTMYDAYDENGCDYYGYTCFDKDLNYVGEGQGVDCAGWTEDDYLTLQDLDEYEREHYYDDY